MDRRIKVILVVTTINLILGVVFVLLMINTLSTRIRKVADDNITNVSNQVSSMTRDRRLELLEGLWQSEDFKNSDAELRRKAFESIVVK